MFECDMCGLCCKNLNQSDLYKVLNRGDGICKFLKDNRCDIYESRLLICRIDESYEMYFKNEMSLEEFYRLNYEGCKKLKEKEQIGRK